MVIALTGGARFIGSHLRRPPSLSKVSSTRQRLPTRCQRFCAASTNSSDTRAGDGPTTSGAE